MKYIITAILIIFLSTSFTNKPTFCDGWKDGYEEGYCDEKNPCVSAVAPACPVPGAGEDTYKGGFKRGFKKGYSDNH